MTKNLFFSYHSPPSRGAYLVIKALNLDVNLKPVNILTHDYLKTELAQINPQHTVPTLQDGDFVIWDSHAIAGYLVGRYGDMEKDSLYPKNPTKRAVVDQRLHFDSGVLFPTIYSILYPILFRRRRAIPPNLVMDLVRSYNFLERFLQNSIWLAGEKLTIADLCCMSSISTLDYIHPINENHHPKLFKYLNQCAELPYYKEANQVGLDMLGKEIQERLIKLKAADARRKDILPRKRQSEHNKTVTSIDEKSVKNEEIKNEKDSIVIKVDVF